MRTAALSFCVVSSLVVSSGCGNSGSDDDGSTTNSPTVNPSIPSNPTADTTETAESTESSPTDGSATGTSNGPSPTGETDSGSTDSPTSTTAVDPSTTNNETTNNPATTNETSAPDDTGPPPCNMVMATLEPIPPNIMFVLDKSGSMVANPNGFWDADADPNTPNISRWNSLFQVVQDIANNNESKINFGATLFPSKAAQSVYNAAACPVLANPEVPVAANNAMEILNIINFIR